MQIHEVTQRPGGIGSAIGDELENLAFGGATTGYDELEPGAEPSLELMKKATASLQGGPALTAQELKQVNDYRVSKGQKPITAANLAAATAQTTTLPQSPEQIRKAKQAITAKAAQDQMAGKPAVANQPAAAPAATNPAVTQSPEQIRKAKQAITAKAAQDQMAGKPAVANQPAAAAPAPATPVDPTAPPEPYYLDDRQLNPSNPNDVRYIKQLQAQGVTSATTGIPKTK